MATGNLNARNRRTVLVAGVAIALLGIAFRGVPAWQAWRGEARGSAAQALAEVARATAMYEAFPILLDSLRARTVRLARVPVTPFAGRDPAEAGSALADLVKAAARSASVEITSLKVQADSSGSGGLPRVSVAVEAMGDVTGLSMMLASLEMSSVAIAIRSLSVAPTSIETPAHEIERLSLRFQIEGLALRREVPQRGGKL